MAKSKQQVTMLPKQEFAGGNVKGVCEGSRVELAIDWSQGELGPSSTGKTIHLGKSRVSLPGGVVANVQLYRPNPDYTGDE